ncbi:MAG TPA: hypothetical protein VFL55_09525 [Acetobacteraceae bacterium]|nr:hypothetical protein [Acetobacteraceae bacterium]
MNSSDAWLVGAAQAKVNRIADAIDGLTGQIELTNSHVERLNREVGVLRGEVGGLRVEMQKGFSRIDGQLREMRLQANQIINARHRAMRVMLRPDTPTS